MADQLTEEQFNGILDRVLASAPKGLSEEQFNQLLDAEVAKGAAKSTAPPSAATQGMVASSTAGTLKDEGFVDEAARRLKNVGNTIGGIFEPGRQFNDAGTLMPKQFDAQGKPTTAEGGRDLGDYVAAHPVRTGAELATMGVPFMVQGAKPLVAPAIAKAIDVLEAPAAGAAIGAAEGYSRGGAKGAIIGGVLGAAGGGTAARIVKRLGVSRVEQGLQPLAKPVAAPAPEAPAAAGKAPAPPREAPGMVEQRTLDLSKLNDADKSTLRIHLGLKLHRTSIEQQTLDKLNASLGGMKSAARANR